MQYTEADYLKIFNILNSEISYGMKLMVLHYSISKLYLKNPTPFEDAPEFWSIEQYNLVSLSILTLGRIFGNSNNNYNLSNLCNALGQNIDIFSFTSLKVRKGEIFDDAGFKEYIDGKSEFVNSDYREIKGRINKLKHEYELDFKGFRDKVIAHREVWKSSELSKTQYKPKNLFDIYLELFNVLRDLQERYHNGRNHEYITFEYIGDFIDEASKENDRKKDFNVNGFIFKNIIKDFVSIYGQMCG